MFSMVNCETNNSKTLSDDSKVKKIDITNWSDEQKKAFQLRDFLTPPPSAGLPKHPSPSSVLKLDDLKFIDEPPDIDEDVNVGEGSEVLTNAACRLRRWRAASRKLRRPRIVEDVKINKCDEGASDVPGRLRGLGAASWLHSSMERLSLAPPPAATAPPSPSCLQFPTLAEQSAAEYFGSSPECWSESIPAPPPGPRYKLASECSLQVCCSQHTRTVINKLLTSKFMRRWETHTVCLTDEGIASKTPCGVLEKPIYYSNMNEVYCIHRWDPRNKYCIRIVLPNGSILIQASNAYTRDQWYYSIVWKKLILRYQSACSLSNRIEIINRALKLIVDLALITPLQDESVVNTPLILASDFLEQAENSKEQYWVRWWSNAEWASILAPLVTDRGPGVLCGALARLCASNPRKAPLPAIAPAVRRVLARNVDFARAPQARLLVTNYIYALSSHEAGTSLVSRFVELAHGAGRRGGTCPHPRAAANLAAAALHALNDRHRAPESTPDTTRLDALCFADILLHMCDYSDWIVTVGGVLQPVPIVKEALECEGIALRISHILQSLANDERCNIHSCLLPVKSTRNQPPSWLKTVSPSNPQMALSQPTLCQLWGDMVGSLLKCCCKRKTFLLEMSKQLPDFLLVAITEHPAALEVLSLMLEWDVVSGEQTRLEIIATLQGTKLGLQYYKELCKRQEDLLQVQAAGGPKRLALPVRATDEDVAKLLAGGSFGNLECLSLAFTSVTSACAYQLIKLPTLRYLNLWATQFGDAGVQLISEHLPKLQVLNLCETPISDKGIESLAALSNLRRLNLNSTKLSAEAFEDLKQKLPCLQEYDIRYTEAW